MAKEHHSLGYYREAGISLAAGAEMTCAEYIEQFGLDDDEASALRQGYDGEKDRLRTEADRGRMLANQAEPGRRVSDIIRRRATHR